jgi:hypothetical protein
VSTVEEAPVSSLPPPHRKYFINFVGILTHNTYRPNEERPPPFALSHPPVRPIAATELVGNIRRIHVIIVVIDDI